MQTHQTPSRLDLVQLSGQFVGPSREQLVLGIEHIQQAAAADLELFAAGVHHGFGVLNIVAVRAQGLAVRQKIKPRRADPQLQLVARFFVGVTGGDFALTGGLHSMALGAACGHCPFGLDADIQVRLLALEAAPIATGLGRRVQTQARTVRRLGQLHTVPGRLDVRAGHLQGRAGLQSGLVSIVQRGGRRKPLQIGHVLNPRQARQTLEFQARLLQTRQTAGVHRLGQGHAPHGSRQIGGTPQIQLGNRFDLLHVVAVHGQVGLGQLQQAAGPQHFGIRLQGAQHQVFTFVHQTPIGRDGGCPALFDLGAQAMIEQGHGHAGLGLGRLIPVGQVGCVDFLTLKTRMAAQHQLGRSLRLRFPGLTFGTAALRLGHE